MTYSIAWDKQAFRFLRKLPNEVAERVLQKLEAVAVDPFRYLEHYERANLYKLRIGDLRALIDVDFAAKSLTVQVLDKRGRIYK